LPKRDGRVTATDAYEALWSGSAVVALDRDVVRVRGPDAEKYLQGQLSQDVVALAPGQQAWSLLLQPQGRLVALAQCARVGVEEFLLVTDGGIGEAVVERLLRFRLRTKAEVENLNWRCLAVRGALAARPEPVVRVVEAHEAVEVPFQWGGLRGYDLLGAAPTAPPGVLALTGEDHEAARVEAGFPRHGSELDERTIPAEAGLVGAAVSFTKGCYTGQELVARIDSRGSNVPRHLRGLLLNGAAQAGAVLASPTREVGRLTSVALSPRMGWVALGYVARGTEVGEILAVASGPVTAQVHPLPLRTD